MFAKNDAGSKYAPLWVMLFSTGAALTKAVGERYLLQREWVVKWSDVGIAVAGAALGYAAYRYRHGNSREGLATR